MAEAMAHSMDDAIRGAMVAALRAPSAHNAQPWRLSPIDGDGYRLWYAYADKLLADPDDRDGIMAVGGFFETLRLAGEGLGIRAQIAFDECRHAEGIDLGTVTFEPLEGPPDPLATAIGRRQCNRHPYTVTPLPPGLVRDLEELGNVLLPPRAVDDLVSEASILSWMDRRFLTDLTAWTRFDDVSPDGMTLACLRVDRFAEVALRLALRLGRLPRWLGWAYARRDVRLTRTSAAMAVLIADDRSTRSLFESGRRLIRSWTTINALGHSWHPMSVVIDQPTAAELARRLGGRDAIAIYRVGYTPIAAAWSNRRPLERVVVKRTV